MRYKGCLTHSSKATSQVLRFPQQVPKQGLQNPSNLKPDALGCHKADTVQSAPCLIPSLEDIGAQKPKTTDKRSKVCRRVLEDKACLTHNQSIQPRSLQPKS